MILRRIADAFRQQDWFVVVLEIFIVVVGIFLGLQVDDWNEKRKNLEQGRVYLALLQTDLANMLAELSQLAAGREERLGRMIAAVDALAACDTGGDAEAAVEYALENYQISPPGNYLGATYDEMVSTGALARIDDIDLKQSIAYTFSQLARLNGRYSSFRTSLTVVDEIVWRNVSYVIAADGRPQADFDIAELCQRPEVQNAFVEMADIQWDSLTSDRNAISSAERLLALLSAKTEGS